MWWKEWQTKKKERKVILGGACQSWVATCINMRINVWVFTH
jgi:hypothetical protein